MIKRLAIRTIVFVILTITAFVAMQPLTISTGWPEVMQCLKAAAILAWGEISIMWIRIAIAPRLDVQDSASLAAKDAKASATVYAVHQFTWAVRLAAFIVLYGVL